MSPKDEAEIRRLILERRARFVAAALSMGGLAACSDPARGSSDNLTPDSGASGSATTVLSTARVCLSAPQPSVCLGMPWPSTTSTPQVPVTSDSSAIPSTVLSTARVCLSAPYPGDAAIATQSVALPSDGAVPDASADIDSAAVDGSADADANSLPDAGDAGLPPLDAGEDAGDSASP